MKEILFRKPGVEDVLEIVEAEIPKAGFGEVVIKACAIGFNPVDVSILSGHMVGYPGCNNLPHRLGADAAGTIHATGDDVTAYKVGDRVWVSFIDYNACGTYAEYFKCPAERVRHLPDKVDMKAAAGIGIPFLTVANALEKANAKPTDVLLVNGGSGAVGRAAVQFGRILGMKVIGTAGNDEGLKLIEKLGAHHVFNYKDPEFVNKVKSCSNGKGVDVVIESVVDVNLPTDMELVAAGGRIAAIGVRSPTCEINLFQILVKSITISGVALFLAKNEQLNNWMNFITAGLENGSLTPTWGYEFPLNDVKKAFAFYRSGQAKGKIVLIP